MENIEFEYYDGNENLLLILTGIGGNVKGYQNKYEKIAKMIVNEYKFSVLVATTPHGSWLHTEQNLDYIMQFIANKMKVNTIYAMGNSAGANILLWHSYKFPQIKKVLAVNPVMNINIHLLGNLKASIKDKVSIIFGENDYSSKFASLIPNQKNLECVILPNIDHTFTNNLDIFLALPYRFLF